MLSLETLNVKLFSLADPEDRQTLGLLTNVTDDDDHL